MNLRDIGAAREISAEITLDTANAPVATESFIRLGAAFYRTGTVPAD